MKKILFILLLLPVFASSQLIKLRQIESITLDKVIEAGDSTSRDVDITGTLLTKRQVLQIEDLGTVATATIPVNTSYDLHKGSSSYTGDITIRLDSLVDGSMGSISLFCGANVDSVTITGFSGAGNGITYDVLELNNLGNVSSDSILIGYTAYDSTNLEIVYGRVGGNTINYGEMYLYENTDLITIEAANEYHAVDSMVEGHTSGFTYGRGSEGSISAFSDYSGTVAGTVLATSTAHTLSTGDIITLHGTTNYNGTFEITRVDANSFYFTDTFVSTETGEWAEGSYLLCNTGSSGVYQVNVTYTANSALSNKRFKFEVFLDTTSQDRMASERLFGNTDYGNGSMTGVLDIKSGQRVWLSVMNETDATDITIRHANLNLTQL